MNASAQAHLDMAKEYVAQGEQYYRMAAEQMLAAKEEGATWVEIADSLGRAESWVRRIVSWHETPANDRPRADAPFGGDAENERKAQGHAKRVLRDTPGVVTELSVDEQRALARKLDEESAKRQKAREVESKRKEREHLGDELVDDLELKEELQTTEYLLIKARGELRGFVKQVNEIGFENTPDAWRASCLDWIEDLTGHLSMARTLLTDGTIIDMSAFEEMLNDA